MLHNVVSSEMAKNDADTDSWKDESEKEEKRKLCKKKLSQTSRKYTFQVLLFRVEVCEGKYTGVVENWRGYDFITRQKR